MTILDKKRVSNVRGWGWRGWGRSRLCIGTSWLHSSLLGCRKGYDTGEIAEGTPVDHNQGHGAGLSPGYNAVYRLRGHWVSGDQEPVSAIHRSPPPPSSHKTLFRSRWESMDRRWHLCLHCIKPGKSSHRHVFSMKHTVLVRVWIFKDLTRAKGRAFRVRGNAVQTLWCFRG